MPKIAYIGISSLESIALKSAMEHRDDIEVQIYSRFDEFHKFSDRFDAFIASTDTILSNVDFFLPRKAKTIGISSSDKGEASVFQLIYRRTDEGDIRAMIERLLSFEKESEPRGDLSQREAEVLKELVSGKTHKEIADTLNISVNTVITHRKNISSKLGIRSISGLSLYAIMNGFA